MGRHLILMDAFKGSISSKEAAEAVASGIRAYDPTAIIDSSPVADGGEGTLDVYLALGYDVKTAMTMDLAGRPCEVEYAVKGTDAVIEVARICGLPMRRSEDDPVRMNTRGVGRLIEQLRDQGITQIRLALAGLVRRTADSVYSRKSVVDLKMRRVIRFCFKRIRYLRRILFNAQRILFNWKRSSM